MVRSILFNREWAAKCLGWVERIDTLEKYMPEAAWSTYIPNLAWKIFKKYAKYFFLSYIYISFIELHEVIQSTQNIILQLFYSSKRIFFILISTLNSIGMKRNAIDIFRKKNQASRDVTFMNWCWSWRNNALSILNGHQAEPHLLWKIIFDGVGTSLQLIYTIIDCVHDTLYKIFSSTGDVFHFIRLPHFVIVEGSFL